MGSCRVFLATSSLSFLLFGLVVFKGILFCQLCRIFSHCLVLFPGHPFLIFGCFSMCVSRLRLCFCSSFSFAPFTFCFIPVWSIYFDLYLPSIYFPANFALYCGYFPVMFLYLRHVHLFVILYIAALFCSLPFFNTFFFCLPITYLICL